ncbi:MAG: Lrp/AsnC ligand binding domain-containing protein [Muribaculaceae bacterium]|nr:Lrp/AsnC ligand binding domain-containing protein [Muribaculaceae bacterium]
MRVRRHNFDTLDINILRMLAPNARKPYLEIARECGVSGAAIHQRIQRLYGNGVITGAESLIAPESIGYDTCAYVGIFLREPGQFDTVVEALRNIPEVVECHYTTGQYDILIKLFARNNDHLLSILQDQIQALGLARTETLISFKEVFKRPMAIPDSIRRK